jgi:hypothetical protein
MMTNHQHPPNLIIFAPYEPDQPPLSLYQAERMARKAHRRQTKQQLNDNDGDDDNEDDKTDYDSGTTSNNTTDDEYFALIAGDDDDDDDDEAAEVEAPWMKRVREAFEAADENADGTLSLMEARNLFVTPTAGAPLLTGAVVGDKNDVTTQTRRLDVLEAKMDRIIQLLEEQQQQRIL